MLRPEHGDRGLPGSADVLGSDPGRGQNISILYATFPHSNEGLEPPVKSFVAQNHQIEPRRKMVSFFCQKYFKIYQSDQLLYIL